jgi:hypothetical protein
MFSSIFSLWYHSADQLIIFMTFVLPKKVDCDHCRIWYHAQCIGMNRETLPNEWLCDTCTLQAVTQEQFAIHGNSDACRTIIDANFAMNRVLQQHLKNIYGSEVAYQFHLAKWTEELEKQSKTKQHSSNLVDATHQVIANMLEQWQAPGVGAASLLSHHNFTEEGGIRSLLSITTSYSSFIKCFNGLMNLMLKLMSDKLHASLRKLSVKAVEKVSLNLLWLCLGCIEKVI